MAAMRVYPKADHAGYELKHAIIEHLRSGHEPVDCGAFGYDAFLATPWSEAERHQRCTDTLSDYERSHGAPPVLGAPA